MAKAIDFVTYDPFAAAAQIKAEKEAAHATSLSLVKPIETPKIQKSSNPVNEQTSEQENELTSLLDEENDNLQENELTSKQVNEQNSKRVNAKTRKLDNKKTISRNWQLGLKIQEKHGKMLKRYAFLNDLFLVDVLEQAIENLVNLKSSKIATTYKERAHQEIDDKKIDLDIDEDHRKSICKIFFKLTGNYWMAGDDADYHRIKHYSVAQIEYAMNKIKKQSKQKIARFGYFAKGIPDEVKKMKSNMPQVVAASTESEYVKFIFRFMSITDADEGRDTDKRVGYIEACCDDEDVAFDRELAVKIATELH